MNNLAAPRQLFDRRERSSALLPIDLLQALDQVTEVLHADKDEAVLVGVIL
jgi:hypothetical protein